VVNIFFFTVFVCVLDIECGVEIQSVSAGHLPLCSREDFDPKKIKIILLSFFCLFFCFVFLCEKKNSFSNLLETLDSGRGPWDLDMRAKMEALDPSIAEILRSHVTFMLL